MTIELGFAHLLLDTADGQILDIGIVDVPGHERFVRTMVAGATGIDLAMLVVAADDGVMPQTREHVEILSLLGVTRGLIALSKCDLVGSERLDAVRGDIGSLVAGTALEDFGIVACSARTGAGLPELRAEIVRVCTTISERPSESFFRMAIDRVFPVQGRGTVVTGSVLAGTVSAGTTLELLPALMPCRVREVQSHGAIVAGAASGQRAALNLTGIERNAIERGMELATPGLLRPSRHLDCRIRIIERLSRPVRSYTRVRASLGTTEAMAIIVVIGADEIPPGGEAFVQLRFTTPIVAAHGQRLILRNETAEFTIGGGEVIRPEARRIRPRLPESVAAIERAASAEPRVRLDEALRAAGFAEPEAAALVSTVGGALHEITAIRDSLQSEGILVSLADRRVHRDTVAAFEQRALAYLSRYHAQHPADPGLARDRFLGWLNARSDGLGREVLSRLEAGSHVLARGPYVAHRGYQPALPPEDATTLSRIIDEITAAQLDPPEWAKLEAIAPLSRPRAKALEEIARTDPRLVQVAAGAFVSAAAMARFKDTVRSLGAGGRRFKLAEVRDRLGLSRRAVQPLLEHLDRIRFTQRVGDERVCREST